MSNLIIGTLENGNKCVYDTPNEIKNAEPFKALIYGYNDNQRQREELQGQPLLLGLNGPMFGGLSASTRAFYSHAAQLPPLFCSISPKHVLYHGKVSVSFFRDNRLKIVTKFSNFSKWDFPPRFRG